MTTETKYYSGQGVVFIGQRDSLGKPKNLLAVGNVPSLKISMATSTIEHKESQTGARAIDLRLTTEVKVNCSITLEDFSPKRLAQALRAAMASKVSAAVTGEAIRIYAGAVTALENIGVSAVVVKQNSVTLTPYVNDLTPYDYKVNADAGSIEFNDGAIIALSKLGIVPTAVSVGATTSITMTNNAVAGDVVSLRGFTGADAATLNGVTTTVVSATPTGIVVAVDTTGKTITVNSTTYVVWTTSEGMVGAVDYTYATQTTVDAMTEAASDVYLRFEGLNTADSNSPVVVDIFKFTSDPLKELLLIGDTIGQFVLDGNVLADSARTSGSPYFSVRTLD